MTYVLRTYLLASALFAASVAMTQPQAPLVRHSFDTSEEGWTGLGANCRASITTQSSFNGSGALKFEYDLRPRAMGLLAWQPQEGALAGANTFRFWVRADQTTSLGFIVQEKGGGRYTAMFAVPKGTWQKVEISLSDLILNQGKDDPKDPSGRLEPEKIEALSIGDLAQFVAQADNPQFASLIGLELGPRVLLLDDFNVTAEKLPATVAIGPKEVVLDTFSRPQVGWLATCLTSVVKGETGAPPAMAASYRQATGRIVALARMIPPGSLKGMGKLSFTAASKQRVMLLVQVEEAGGGKFNTILEVPEGNSPKSYTIEFANLNAADDSPVRDRGLRPELAGQVVFIDASMLAGASSDADNTLTIRNLKALPSTP